MGAKLAALVRDAGEADIQEAGTTGLGAGAAGSLDGVSFVLQEYTGPASFAGAVLHALRAGSSRLVLFCDAGASAAARLARWFDLEIDVRTVQGPTSESVAPEPLPVALEGPSGAEDLLELMADRGLEVLAEQGEWRGELLGLEVARVVLWPEETGGDGRLHLEAGVGRFDRDAVAAMHQGETPVQGLERAVVTVSERRHEGVAANPLSLLARSRWLRADALRAPVTVGAASLEPIQTSFAATSVRDEVPCAALGTTIDGEPLVVVFAAGAGLDLTPIAADTRELHRPDARLRLALAPRDHLVVTDELAALLRAPVDVVEIDPGWA